MADLVLGFTEACAEPSDAELAVPAVQLLCHTLALEGPRAALDFGKLDPRVFAQLLWQAGRRHSGGDGGQDRANAEAFNRAVLCTAAAFYRYLGAQGHLPVSRADALADELLGWTHGCEGSLSDPHS